MRCGLVGQPRFALVVALVAGNAGHARVDHQRAWRRPCCPSRRIASGDGPMNTSPASRQACGEVLVLGQEAVARVHGVGAGLARRVDDAPRCSGTTARAAASPMHTAWSASRTWRGVGIGAWSTPPPCGSRARGRCASRAARSRRGWRSRILWNGVMDRRAVMALVRPIGVVACDRDGRRLRAGPPRTACVCGCRASAFAADRQHLGQHGARVARVDHAVVEHAARWW